MRVQPSGFFSRLSPRGGEGGRLRDRTEESIIIDPEYINKDITRETCPAAAAGQPSHHDSLRIELSFIRKYYNLYLYHTEINKIFPPPSDRDLISEAARRGEILISLVFKS